MKSKFLKQTIINVSTDFPIQVKEAELEKKHKPMIINAKLIESIQDELSFNKTHEFEYNDIRFFVRETVDYHSTRKIDGETYYEHVFKFSQFK